MVSAGDGALALTFDTPVNGSMQPLIGLVSSIIARGASATGRKGRRAEMDPSISPVGA